MPRLHAHPQPGLCGETEERGVGVQLQFQDRVAQILSHVKTNIERMPACLAEHRDAFERSGNVPPLSAAELLRALESTYAMAEERQVHRGGRQARAAAPAQTEVTFF